MERFYSARFFFRWFVRSLVISILFLALGALEWFLEGAFGNVHSSDLVAIGEHVCWYEERQGGKSPESLQEVFKNLLSEKSYRRYLDDYLLVPKSAPFPILLTDWAVVSKRPKWQFFPYPTAKIYYLTREKVFSDSFEVDDGAKSLSVANSRQFTDWLAQNDEAFNRANKKRLIDDYFVPLVVDGALLLVALLAIVVHTVRAVRRERRVRKALQTAYSAILKFRTRRQRDPRSEHEVREASPSEPFDVGLTTPYRYIGKLGVKYGGRTILVVTKKTRLSPFFPLFGGKRLSLLLEDGSVVKVRGSLSTDLVFDTIRTAEKSTLDARTSKSFFNVDGVRENREQIKGNDASAPPETAPIFSIKRTCVFAKALRILIPPAIIVTFFTAFIFFGAFMTASVSDPDFGADDWLFAAAFSTEVAALGLALASPFFYVVFNYYAEY